MNVIIFNEQQQKLNSLDIDIIKSINGQYSANEIVEMFKNFFFSRMILDVTAIKNYENPDIYKTIVDGLEAEKIIFFIPEGSSLCTPIFLARLIKFGIYNFTTNIEGVKYLLNKPNTYNDVINIERMAGPLSTFTVEEQSELTNDKSVEAPRQSLSKANLNRTIRIGLKNLTEHSGATSLIYMMKKELSSIFGDNQVIAIEVDKNDFQFYHDKTMISTSNNELRSVVERYNGVSIILIDLNSCEDSALCDDILYLLEPSTLKLNKLVKRNNQIFQKLKDKKIILNQSLLTNKDVSELEYEAGTRFYYNLPPVNDRKRNEVLTGLLTKLGLIEVNKSDTGKIFGLFRR